VKKKFILYSFLCCVVLCCSVKRNNFKNRTYHKINSDFNTVFNGQETLEEELDKIKNVYNEDFTTVLRLEKMPLIKKNDTMLLKEADTKGRNVFASLKSKISLSGTAQNQANNEEKPTGLDRTIEKSTKAIGNHSMFIRGQERNSSMYKPYVMIGKTRFYRGQSLSAVEAFEYAKEITRKKNHKAKEEIKRWLAKAYHQLGNDQEAEKIYVDLIENAKHKKKLKNSLFDYTQFYLDNEKYNEADLWLEKAIEGEKNRKNKARLLFISGQLKFLINQNEASLNQFILARKYKLSEQLDLKTYTNYIFQKTKIDSVEEKSLEKKLNKYLTKILYLDYKDEVYYALALLYNKQNKKKLAEEYFAKSLKETPSDADNRMLIYKRFGEKFFFQDRYDLAKKYYDSAYSFARPQKKEELKDRVDKLTSLNDLYNYVAEKDSILKLTKLPKEELKLFFENHISNLKKIEAEKEKKESEKKAKLTQEEENKKSSKSFVSKKENKGWYFYNTMVKNLGVVDFKKKWGNRFLADNWRKTSRSVGEFDAIQNKDEKEKTKKQDSLSDKYNVDKYLEKIPNTAEKITEMIHGRDSTQLKLGVAYYNYFKNINKSAASLNDLIAKKPLNEDITQKAYFNLYKMYRAENREEEMKKYEQILLQKYPESMYSSFVKNPTAFLLNESTEQAISIYKSALDFYQKESFDESLSLIDAQISVYRGQAIEPKFAILRAYNIAKTKGKDEFVKELKKIQFLYETSAEAEKSREILKTILTEKKEPEKTENTNPASVEEKQKNEASKELVPTIF
jgi:tetratricopeptide (TPR) repeat protein